MNKQIRKHKSRRFRRFLKANKAVSALEYALVVGVVATVVAAALVLMGTEIKTGIAKMQAEVKEAVAAADD